MDEKLYEEILTEAGMDFETIHSGEKLSREIARNDNTRYEQLLLDDALECLNHIIPQVKDLDFYQEVIDGKSEIIVECSEIDRAETYHSGLITDMLDELEEVREEENFRDDYELV